MKRMASMFGSIFMGVMVAGSAFAGTGSPAPVPAENTKYSVSTLALPDNNDGDIAMDYISYDAATNTVWVPGGNTGAVDVVDAATGKVRQVTGFPTKEVEAGGSKRVVGPSGVSVGVGVVYIGSRGDSSICAVGIHSLKRGVCGKIDTSPDATIYIPTTKEVYVSSPSDKTIRVLDAKTLKEKSKMTFEGAPEGYAVDAKNGRYYTNLEDKDRTLVIDPKTQKTISTWETGCGKEGPRGLQVDPAAGILIVACTTSVRVLDTKHDGALLSQIETGAGVDDLGYSPVTHMLYVGAGTAAKLTVAHVDEKGQLSVVAEVPTQPGVRNAVVAKDGTVYLAHSRFGKISGLVVAKPEGK
jgi:hypothetical protein